MSDPQVIIGGLDAGHHNADLDAAANRIEKSKAYRDLSTVMVMPTRGVIPARTVETLLNLAPMMNQGFARMFISGMEVGEAYEHALDIILGNPGFDGFKYLLTVEEDNLIPPDALHRLFESIGKPYSAIGGLYWTKGEGGMPMIYGDPKGMVDDFRPQRPVPNTVQECNGLGMGCTLFDLSMFRDGKVERPFFKTLNGPAVMTQDLYFFRKARTAGYRVACDTRVRVGHLDPSSGRVW